MAYNNLALNSLHHESGYGAFNTGSGLLNKPYKTTFKIPGDTPPITMNPAPLPKTTPRKTNPDSPVRRLANSSHITHNHQRNI